MQERCVKIFLDGFPADCKDILDVARGVTASLEYDGFSVKRVTIGDQTFHNPEWGRNDE